MAQAQQGKVVAITGASSGIGAALAARLVRGGMRVLLIARRESELRAVAAPAGDRARVVVADVTQRPDVLRAVQAGIAEFGHIDVWVNNAGRGISRSVLELTDEDFDDMMLVNVKSALYGIQAVIPHFLARETGHVINISSMLGRIPLAPMRAAYSASKHALNALTANLRMDLRTHPGIHVSTVSPGVVATEFGVKARHGGVDSRQIPNAQPVDEVAEVVAGVIENPRADVYTIPKGQEMVVRYFSAPDMGAAETQLLAFGPPTPRST